MQRDIASDEGMTPGSSMQGIVTILWIQNIIVSYDLLLLEQVEKRYSIIHGSRSDGTSGPFSIPSVPV